MFTFGLLKLRGVVKFFLVVVKPYLRNQLRFTNHQNFHVYHMDWFLNDKDFRHEKVNS